MIVTNKGFHEDAKPLIDSVPESERITLGKYLFDLYDKESIYANLYPTERRKRVRESYNTHLKTLDKYGDLLEDLRKFIETQEQRMARQLQAKIEETLEVVSKMEVSEENVSKCIDILVETNKLFTLEESIRIRADKYKTPEKGKGSKTVNKHENITYNKV